MIYNSFIAPNNVTTDSYYLRYEFTEAMLDAMGIKDYTGVLYELISYRYFADDDLGVWDLMIDGMINVSPLKPLKYFYFILLSACWNLLHQGINIRVYEV